MAVKKSTKKKDQSAAPAKAEAKETAPKTTTKKAAPKAAAATAAIAPPAAPTPPPAPEPTAKTVPKKAAKKAAAPVVKLSASQDDLLKKIGTAADSGYLLEKKAEQRSIDSLLEKKLIKKGAKDKTSGAIRYHISSAGKKHTS